MVITLSSVVSSLKMDATKILEEMDQFKELWNQVNVVLSIQLPLSIGKILSCKMLKKKYVSKVCWPDCSVFSDSAVSL